MRQGYQQLTLASNNVSLLVLRMGPVLVSKVLRHKRKNHVLVPAWKHKLTKGALILFVMVTRRGVLGGTDNIT